MKRKIGMGTQAFLIISLLLLAANIILCVLMTR